MCELLKADAVWNWSDEHQQSFDALKNSLSEQTMLNYSDVRNPTKAICDASPDGLGAALVQTLPNGQDIVIAYASRSLTGTEKNYSQIEREALAIYFSCFRYKLYLLGKFVIVYSDHQPLESMFNNVAKNLAFGIERMRLKLQGLSFQVKHIKDKTNPSDYASRQPLPIEMCTEKEKKISEELKKYVNQILLDTQHDLSYLYMMKFVQKLLKIRLNARYHLFKNKQTSYFR